MIGRARCREPREIHRRSNKRTAHEVDIDDEAAQERPDREEHADAVRAERVAACQRARDERRERSHQHARHETHEDAPARRARRVRHAVGRRAPPGQRAVSLSIEDDREDREADAQREQRGTPARLQQITQHHAHDQGHADRKRERDGEPRHLDARDEKQICDVENESADKGRDDVADVRRRGVGEEPLAARRRPQRSQGQRPRQRHEHDADCVIPVEKLEPIAARQLVCVGPRPPAHRARDRHQKCDREGLRREHAVILAAAGPPSRSRASARQVVDSAP